MKQYKYLSTLALLVLFIYSCSENPNSPIQDTFDLESKIKVVNNGDTFTETFLDFGVEKVFVRNEDDIISIEFYAPNLTLIGESFTIESTLNFYIKDQVLYIEDFPGYGATLSNGAPFIISSKFKGAFEEISENEFNDEILLLMLALTEITSDQNSKRKNDKSCSNILSSLPSCDGTEWYVSSFAWGRSVAESNVSGEAAAELVQEYEDENDMSCTKIGDVDSSCILDNHACYASQAYCCQ